MFGSNKNLKKKKKLGEMLNFSRTEKRAVEFKLLDKGHDEKHQERMY